MCRLFLQVKEQSPAAQCFAIVAVIYCLKISHLGFRWESLLHHHSFIIVYPSSRRSNDRAATKLPKKVEALSVKWIKQAFVSSYHPPLCLSLCLPVLLHISPHLSLYISFSGRLSSRQCVTPVCVSACLLTHLSNSLPVFVPGCIYLPAFISLSVSVQPDLTVVSAPFQSVTC